MGNIFPAPIGRPSKSSHPHVYGKYKSVSPTTQRRKESSPCVWEIYLLARANTQPSRNSQSHSVDELRVSLNGDPQTVCCQLSWSWQATEVTCPFIPSPVSHRRGCLVTEAFYYASARRRSASCRMLIAALRSRSITAWQCPHLYTRSFRVSLVSGRSPQLLQVCEDG